MSNSLTINTPNIVQQNTPLRNVPSGSTATPDYSVKYVPQDLTEAQQAQARQNIGAAAAGEGGGATINEFHYLRDTTTDPTTYYIDADGYEPKEGDLITIVWDWPFRTNENDPDAAFKNPATLKNNSTNPSIYIKNAHQMATDYDEIDPEVNTRWTVRLEKVDNTWYAYNISTAVQADWNTSDSTMPSYIKNKPTIPGAQVQSDWNQSDSEAVDYIKNKPSLPTDEITEDRRPSFTLVMDYNKTYDIGDRLVNKYKVYNNGILLTPGGNNGTTYSLTKGKVVLINTAGDDTCPEAHSFYDTNKPMTWIKIREDDMTFSCATAATNARIFQKIILSNNGVIDWYGNLGGSRLTMPNSPNSVVYFNKYWWSRLSYDGNPTWYGKIIFANVEVPTNTNDIDPTHQPNVSNMDGIYVHRSKETDFKNWLTGIYQSGADLSALFAKIKPYDYLSQYDENCPGDAPQPIVLPTT